MKAMLYTAVEEAPSAENVEPEVLSRHFANFDETFFHYCDQELKKINTFYSGTYSNVFIQDNRPHLYLFTMIHCVVSIYFYLLFSSDIFYHILICRTYQFLYLKIRL